MTNGTSTALNTSRTSLRSFASLIKISHTVFAMPFALAMFVIVTRDHSATLMDLLWIVAALITARTAAMGYNRYVDRDVDALNPRTASRELPAGVLSERSVLLLVVLSSCGFIGSAFMLGTDCGLISPLVLIALLGYSHAKRFTSYAHLVLGLALALAPGGVWYAIAHSVETLPLWLMFAVLFWVAGFDIIYSCQDITFDRARELYSIPARLGVARSLLLARWLHLLAIIFLLVFGSKAQLGAWYFIGTVAFGLVMFSQHLIVGPEKLERVNVAFFTRNGLASIIFFLGTALDVYL